MFKKSSFGIFAIILAIGLLTSYSTLKELSLNKPSKKLEITQENKAKIVKAYEKTPLSFEENLGQTDSKVKFLSRGNGYNLFLTSNKATLSLTKPNKINSKTNSEDTNKTLAVEMSILGANPSANVVGEKPLAKSNYFTGNDPSKWKSSINNYKQIRYQEIYDGVDLVYYGNQRQLEYDFIVKPGANPDNVKLSFNGIDKLNLDEKGNLVLNIAGEEIIQHKPLIYQTIDGVKETIDGSYLVLENNQVAFVVENYDKSKELVIDPVLAYSTYLGGNSIDFMSDIAVNDSGEVYLVGETQSPNYPLTPGVLDNSLSGASAAFVTKLDSSGSKLIYSSFLGGGADNNDAARSIVIDSDGNAYIVGITSSESFPVTSGAFQTTLKGTVDTFVAKLNPTGSSLLYATYLGGTNVDNVSSIAIDANKNAYLVGSTQSLDFPVTSGVFQSMFGGSNMDGFVAKLDPTGTSLIYSTYLGGTGNDVILDVAVDSGGNVYLAGSTRSMNFITTEGCFQKAFGGGDVDGFVTKLDPNATSVIYSTFLGGTASDSLSGGDSVNSIALDKDGNLYLVGDTSSSNFPTTEGAFQTQFPGSITTSTSSTAFVSKLNPIGTSLEYSSFLGGDTFDNAVNVVIDSMGRAYILGNTSSANFPVTRDAIQVKSAGELDVFLVQLDPTGKELVYSTLLGGSSSELAVGITIDKSGNLYLAGITTSDNYPTSKVAFQSKFDSVIDGFVSRISEGEAPPPGMPMATISTTNLTFAKQKIGTTSAAMTVTISSRGTAPLNILKLSTTGDYAATSTCANAPIDSGKDCIINVTFTPTGTKVRTGTLVIMDDADGSPRTVSLSGRAKK